MRRLKVVGFMLAGLLALPGAVRSAHAAPLFAYCLTIDGHADQYFLNFNVQGNSIMVSGMMNRVGDDHGPIAGSVSPAPSLDRLKWASPSPTNGGDYAAQFPNRCPFHTNGSISFRRSVQGTSGLQGSRARSLPSD